MSRHYVMLAGSSGTKQACKWQCRYGELELQHLRGEAASLEVPSTSESTEAVVAGMKAVVPHVLQLCEAAVGRCMRLTQGTEVQALCIALDDTLESFVEKLKVWWPTFLHLFESPFQRRRTHARRARVGALYLEVLRIVRVARRGSGSNPV